MKSYHFFGTVWVDPEVITPSEKSQTKNTNTTWFYVCVESKEQNEWTNTIETDSDTENRLMVANEGEGSWGEKGEGIKKSKLVVTK